MTSAYAGTPACTDLGGGGGEFQDNPTRGGECHLFLAGNRAVLLGNRRFSWREIGFFLKLSLFSKTIRSDRSEV